MLHLPPNCQRNREVSTMCLANDCRTHSTLLIYQTIAIGPLGYRPYRRSTEHLNVANSEKLNDNPILVTSRNGFLRFLYISL